MTHWRYLQLTPVIVALAGCAIMKAPQLEPGWTRDEFEIGDAFPGVAIRTDIRQFAPHEIPGWNRGVGRRILGAIFQEAVRSAGGLSDHTVVALGTRTLTESRTGGWRARCSLFRMDDQTIERVDGEDEVSHSQRRTQGIHCDAALKEDSAGARWRLRTGIAPPRDSLAAVYDSLAAAGSSDITRFPPGVIERVDPLASPQNIYDLAVDTAASKLFAVVSHRITRRDGSVMARLHQGMRVTFDYSPDATTEEKQLARLFGAALVVPF